MAVAVGASRSVWAALRRHECSVLGCLGARVAAAAAGRRSFGVRVRHRGSVYVPRKVQSGQLHRSKGRHSDSTLLLPPYISATELRILFRLDYEGTFRLLNVTPVLSRYFWKDFDGREFETSSKRKVLVPFEMAAGPCRSLGYNPKMVDVEPDWDETNFIGSAPVLPGQKWEKLKAFPKALPIRRTPLTSSPAVPIVAVLGHIDHGKTTLLDALCGTDIAESEPGGITQGVRAMTWRVTGPKGARLKVLPYSDTVHEAKRLDAERMTFLDTPGHEAFELTRGKTVASADVALVVVSVEHGAEVQTEEVLLHAAKWKVPVVFALNKIDLPQAHIELTRAELRRQCQRLNEQGLVDVDWTREAEQAVPISALLHQNLGDLVRSLCSSIEALPAVPSKVIPPPTLTLGESAHCRNVQRRTDYLVGIEQAPAATALVVEVERGAETGEHVLTVIVRAGRLFVGQFFCVGTAFGRITHLSIATGLDGHNWYQSDTASVGMAAQIMGLRLRKLGGDCAPDDMLFVYPRERAWRLCDHRRRIEDLIAVQVGGPPIDTAWVHDSELLHRAPAAFSRREKDHPEKHSKSAYERRFDQLAVEEFGGSDEQPPRFVAATRRQFEAKLEPRSPQGMLISRQEDPSIDEQLEKDQHAREGESGGRRGRGFRNRREADAYAASSRKFMMVQRNSSEEVVDEKLEVPDADQEDGATVQRGGGRRSKRRDIDALPGGAQRLPQGAWSSPEAPSREFVYYTDRKNFEEEADIDSTRLRSRWRWRDRERWAEEEKEQGLQRVEKKLVEALRRDVYGKPQLPDSEDEGDAPEQDEEEDELAEPLPPKNRPVVSLILKTKTMGQFDLIMDEIEHLQAEYRMRLVIVHGGLGPAIPKDVTHAQVEKEYGFCPIYTFQVGCHPVAKGQAETEHIEVKRFDVFTDLVDDLRQRCEGIRGKAAQQRYTESLRQAPSQSGL